MNNLTNLRLIEKFVSKNTFFSTKIRKIYMTDDEIGFYVTFDRTINAYFMKNKKWDVSIDNSGFINCCRTIGGIKIEICLW